VAICDPLAKAQELEARAKKKRLDAWNSIKELSPETADWMLHMNKVFGQHKYINTEINGTVLLDKGIQDGVRDMTIRISGKRW
jgi:hypothetical protein